jgi:hypothetical protein
MKFRVTLTYEVNIGNEQDDRPTPMHLLEAVYQTQVGNDKGTTDWKPAMAYEVEETLASFEEVS